MADNNPYPWNELDDEADFYSEDFEDSEKNNWKKEILSSPSSIYSYLDERVYGQTEYKKAISVFIYKALKGINSEKVLLVAAESGTGKSHLISVLSEILDNMAVADGASLVPAGYKGGNHITTVLNKIDTDGDAAGFVVIDEFNRFLSKGEGTWSETSLLSELLVLFDNKDVTINAASEGKPFWVNPKNLFFILLGSFSDITDKKESSPIGFNASIRNDTPAHRPQITKEQILESLSNWPELIGRISRIIVNPNLSENDYYNMLASPKYSPASLIEQELNIHINMTDEKMHEFAQSSYESGTGVRCVKNAIIEVVDEALFNDPEVKEVYIQ